MSQPTVSIIVPVFNEERTVQSLLERLAVGPYANQEVIVVDDGSSDRTPEILAGWGDRPGFLLLCHPRNRGKGAAVRTGLARATGQVTVIQDADLEYDPADLPRLVAPILGGECEAVYGSRYLRAGGSLPWSRFRVAVNLMNGIVRLLYGVRLTDVNTCYKVLRTDLYKSLDLRCERFEFCAEVTAKLCRRGVRIVELPISYRPRTSAEGKKIRLRDAWEFAVTLLGWRFTRLPAPDPGSTPVAPAQPHTIAL
jgi:glycosyltransferase involved in cell wall biosynthesis